jgi:hypothetical protein
MTSPPIIDKLISSKYGEPDEEDSDMSDGTINTPVPKSGTNRLEVSTTSFQNLLKILFASVLHVFDTFRTTADSNLRIQNISLAIHETTTDEATCFLMKSCE